MSDVDCSCRCYHCDDSLNHDDNDRCYDTKMAYSDLAYCDCSSCFNTAMLFNTCGDCDVNGANDED